MRPADVRPPVFVGRERELAALTEALARPSAVVLIEGEAGIGKTRLIREFLAARPASGRTTLVATCPPFRRPHTLGPVVDALRQATTDVRRLRLSPLSGALRPLFPEWAAGLPPVPGPLRDEAAARHRLFGALADVLGQLSVAEFVLEDVHWADDTTLDFLLFLAGRQPRAPRLVVSYRPEDVPAGSPLRELFGGPSAPGTRVRVPVAPLDVAATAGLVSSMLGSEPVSEAFAAFLNERTEGLPLAIEESVRLLCERADVTCQDGEWVRVELAEIEVPPTVRDAVLERARRLGPAARSMLTAAAVLGGPAGAQVLAAVSELPAADAGAGLAEALGCGLLTEEHGPDGEPLIAFRHALAARAVYEQTPPSRRRELHLRAGEALEAQAAPARSGNARPGETPPSASPFTALLARHFREARQTAKWCQYGEQAADLALAAGDSKTAATLLHDLLLGADPPPATVVLLARKIELYGLIRHDLHGDLADVLRRARDARGLSQPQRAEIRFHLGRILLDSGEFTAAADELKRAVPGLAHRPTEAARAMIWLGWPHRNPYPAKQNKRWLNRVPAMLATAPSMPEGDRLALTFDRATALLNLGERAGWAATAELPRDAAAARRTDPRVARQVTIGCLNASDAAVHWGRYADARGWLAAAGELAERFGYPRIRNGVLVTVAHIDWCTGAWPGLADRVAALTATEDPDPLLRMEAFLIAGLLDAAAGRPTAAGRLRWVLDEGRSRGLADAPLLMETTAALARLELADGRPDEAVALTGGSLRAVERKGIWLWATEVAPVRAQALAAVGRTGDAADLIAGFARGARGGGAPAMAAAVTSCRAILAQALGDTDRAAALFARAAAAWEALPQPYRALLARERRAYCLLAADRKEAGLELYGDVLRGLSRLGASADAERVIRTLRSHGAPVHMPWHGGQRGYGDRLSPRETEVVRLAVAGHTNRQIAEVLCRSPHTVNTQMRSAMRKLGVTSRAALAVSAVNAGLLTGPPAEDSSVHAIANDGAAADTPGAGDWSEDR
jgi:DNA-binding CsgD family transcriptional regulator/tetratricopeptide (TPR) repeat protein